MGEGLVYDGNGRRGWSWLFVKKEGGGRKGEVYEVCEGGEDEAVDVEVDLGEEGKCIGSRYSGQSTVPRPFLVYLL